MTWDTNHNILNALNTLKSVNPHNNSEALKTVAKAYWDLVSALENDDLSTLSDAVAQNSSILKRVGLFGRIFERFLLFTRAKFTSDLESFILKSLNEFKNRCTEERWLFQAIDVESREWIWHQFHELIQGIFQQYSALYTRLKMITNEYILRFVLSNFLQPFQHDFPFFSLRVQILQTFNQTFRSSLESALPTSFSIFSLLYFRTAFELFEESLVRRPHEVSRLCQTSMASQSNLTSGFLSSLFDVSENIEFDTDELDIHEGIDAGAQDQYILQFIGICEALRDMGIMLPDGDMYTDMVYHFLEKKLVDSCKGDFESRRLKLMQAWLSKIVFGWLAIVIGGKFLRLRSSIAKFLLITD
ncbi:hypothetical protein BKA69DRAFT_1087708 [Paraphysoderma sedebokerense]|nr:hypothetical protein BKA69DRAFT_1087708 [Paraphysoderma sedebokerense]